MDRAAEVISITEVSSLDYSDDIYNEWLDLWQRSSLSTPFQSPAWIVPWWKTFGTGRLFVLSLRLENRLIAVAPFYIYRLEVTGMKQLTMIGTGNTDYMDITVEDNFAQMASEAIIAYITERVKEWDICYFQGLRESSPLLTIKLGEGFISELSKFNMCPVVSLPDSFEKYLSSLPVSFRKNTKRARNNLYKSGKLFFETANKGTLKEYLSELFMLHEKSWHERNRDGVLKGAKIRQFHEDAAEKLLENGTLRLYRLRFNDKAIAAVYSMLKSGRLFYYIGGFDPEMKKLSPGSVLILYIIEDLIKRKIREFDFLMGAEDYKYNWGAKDNSVFRMIIRKGF